MKNKQGIEIPDSYVKFLGYLIAKYAIKRAEAQQQSKQSA